MRVLIFGATGMVGQGALRECLLAADVTAITAIGRTPTGIQHAKLRELAHTDMFDYRAIESELTGFDACFFCLGMTSSGRTEQEYTRFTYDLTLAAAATLARLNPQMTFIYMSGAGADSSEKSPVMWSRVRGRTENALLALPFRAYAFRPGAIQPLNGARSKTPSYRVLYAAAGPLMSLLRWVAPKYIATTESIGAAMLEVARNGAPKRVLETPDIHALAEQRGRGCS